MSIDPTNAQAWNKCPVCGEPVPPNEWVSYMRCEDCWAANVYNPPQATIVTRVRKPHGRIRPERDYGG